MFTPILVKETVTPEGTIIQIPEEGVYALARYATSHAGSIPDGFSPSTGTVVFLTQEAPRQTEFIKTLRDLGFQFQTEQSALKAHQPTPGYRYGR